MSQDMLRRGFIKAVAAGTLVTGFDPIGRTWITEAHARGNCCELPELDGVLSTETATLDAAADDFGHIVSNRPVAVLLPGSVNDVIAIVRYARCHDLKVAMRGQGHSQFGQAQTAGVVIDMSTLADIHEISTECAVVDAGVTWAELVQTATTQGLTPPVLTDYLGLSVGGTLSAGGIGGAMQHFGTQADNVLELEVVTGRGQLVTCSARRHRHLFDAVLTGLGQSALIVRATVRLVPAESHALVFRLYYTDLETFLEDQRTVLEDGRFSYLEGQALPLVGGSGWRYMLEAAVFFTPPQEPDQQQLLAGLQDERSEAEIATQSYLDFAFRLEPTIAFLKRIGVWGFPHPWVSLWVPGSEAENYLGRVMSELSVEDTGQGPVLIYPINTAKVGRPLFRLPRERTAFAFNILRTAPPAPEPVAQMLADNRDLYDKLKRLDGTRYAIGAIEFSQQDWRRHFGRQWRRLRRAKRHYDPNQILTPGQGIFD